MKNFIIYNQNKILRTGVGAGNVSLQRNSNEFAMEGTANDATQKVEFDGLDDEGQPINPRVVNKTPEEIKADKPPEPEPEPIPFEKQPASITNKQWQDIQSRLEVLENE